MSGEREPLYLRIRNHFKDRIASRELTEDEKIPTEKELMRQFGVSRITVVNALTELAKEGWIYRIPGRGTYVRGIPEAQLNDSAAPASARDVGAAQKTENRRKVGLVFPSLADEFAVRLVRGVADQLQKQGYALHMVLTHNSKEQEKEAIRELKSGVDGLVIFPVDAEVYNEEIILLKMQRYPFVLIDRLLPGVETNAVFSDGRQAMKLAVDHLWELGHRNIAVCSDSPLMTASVDERIQGYFDALKQKGALIDPAMILNDLRLDPAAPDAEGNGKPTEPNDAGHPLRRMIESRAATAYIALNSSLGIRIREMAREAGLSVPEHLSIVAFDNPTSANNESGLLTHIDQSEYVIGVEAVKLLVRHIEKEPGEPDGFEQIRLDPRLVICRSTGPAARRI
ncbi:GntR family transcriptional regulator [Saccharibacillus sacchari]|uniref:GntR family transcriptional regulator n=1 Tax=Saccharibacillus sacchari TaxID=456493 RepID=UPI0004B8E68F|nr:GntR family transcriptional regulator [Saccharibacillus sacchari]